MDYVKKMLTQIKSIIHDLTAPTQEKTLRGMIFSKASWIITGTMVAINVVLLLFFLNKRFSGESKQKIDIENSEKSTNTENTENTEKFANIEQNGAMPLHVATQTEQKVTKPPVIKPRVRSSSRIPVKSRNASPALMRK